MLISGNSRKTFFDTLRNSGLLWTLALVLTRFGFRALRFWPDKNINPELLESQVGEVLRAWGMAGEHIATTARHIVYADLHGIDSHGCAMLVHYHRQLRTNSITMTPKIEVIRESDTTAVIDGGGGLGHAPADIAMQLAIEKCRDSGVAIVTVRNSGHFGAAGAYAAMAAQSGLIGIAMTNVRTPALVPSGGLTAALGTNPIAFAAPACKNKPFLLDMATSIVPVGKIVMARRRGRLIPSGWAQNASGKTLRNPDKALSFRRLAPLGSTNELGGHKGYGLAAMVEILSSLLGGNNNTSGVGHFFLVLNPERFGEREAFSSALDDMLDGLRSTQPMASGQPVQVAGDPEYAAADSHRRDGIPLARAVIEDIRLVCRETGARFSLEPAP